MMLGNKYYEILVKLLIVHNNREVINKVLFCVQIRYPDVEFASCDMGLEGIKSFEIESPDLLIAGSSLPVIDIVDLIVRIRKFSDVPLIVLLKGESDIDKARVYVSPKDVAAVQKLVKEDKELASKVAEVKDFDCVGGVIVEDVDGKIRIDNTYDTRLETLLPQILPEIGEELFGAL